MSVIMRVLLAGLVLFSLSGCLVEAPIDAAADVGSVATHVAMDAI